MPLAGGTFTGDVAFDGATAGRDILFDRSENALSFEDNSKATFGSSGDLQIYHDGSNTYLDNHVGVLYLRGDGDNITLQAVDGENALIAKPNGAVELYHNGTEMFYTSASGCHVGRPSAAAHLHFLDGGIARFGSSNDLQIYHDGTNSYLQHGTVGHLKYQANNHDFYNQAGSEFLLRLFADNAVHLFYNGDKKFETTSDGGKLHGGNLSIYGTEGGYARLQLGADEGDDAADWWQLQSQADNNFQLGHWTGSAYENAIIAEPDGAVKLYYNGTNKFETEPKGIIVNGGGSGEGLVQIIGANSSSSTIEFGDTDDDDVAQIWYDHYGTSLNLRTSETAEIKLFTNNVETARFYDGDFTNSKTSYAGSFSSSTGNSAFGWKFYHNGRANDQISANSYGAEIINCNNTHSSGGSISLLQYRTLNVTEGSLTGDSSGLGISNVSDYRKKERITDLTGSLAVLDTLKPRQYYYRAGFGKPARAFAGFIAHELQETSLPQLAIGTKDAVVTQADKDNGLYDSMSVGDPVYQTVKYSSDELITHLVNGIKELKAEVETLKTQVAALGG